MNDTTSKTKKRKRDIEPLNKTWNEMMIEYDIDVLDDLVKSGRAPDEWAKGFADSQLLSDAKVEQAKHATH